MKELKLIVAGKAGTGKSHLISELKTFLRNKGFYVELAPYIDYPNEMIFNRKTSNHHDEAIESMLKNCKIIIEEKQTQRKLHENI